MEAEHIKGHRRENRIAAMQFLYLFEAQKSSDVAKSLKLFFSSKEKPATDYAFAKELAEGALMQLSQIDEKIKAHAENWAFGRIAKVDLAILRLAIYELEYRRDIPPVVSINEAIELAKEFSDADSKRFINGILDKIKDTLDRPLREPS